MKSLLYILFIFSSCLVYGQEICDNAIDDDGDGLIDLNDEDCECSGGVDGELASLIPNPSFEDRDCCPTGFGQLHCAETWIQASTATSDYYNNCDFNTPTGYDATWFDPETPLPGGGGDGFVGFISNNSGYLEYVGAHLISPLLAGTEYTLNMYTAYANGYVDFEFSLFGTPEPTDLPWLGTNCPVPGGDWELLTSLDIVYTPDGAWQEITLTFTPAVDIYAIAIGGPCNPDPPAGPDGHNYYYVDGLTLIDSESFNSAISESGDWCDGDLALEASTDTSGGTWQWYKDGIALIGETDEVIDIMPYGLGDYSAVYFLGDDCIRKNHSVDEGEIIEVDFDFDNICAGQEFTFSNTSIVGPGVSPDWDWDFGDGDSSDDENPSHVFDEPGVYDVELIGLNDVGCNDTILKEVTVYPIPDANLEFVVNGVSSEDGGTGGCVLNDVQFNDISSIESGSIVDWAWSFGDGGVSDEENPIHTYGAAGTYTVTLVVTSDAGCSDVYELEIVMTNSLTLDLIINEPSCYGFSDGSITVNVEGAAGDLVFVISDEDGVTINEDNSNTANTLSTGWYYFDVSDGSGCDA
uniref:PKD domain-containing protein n=1 Tax=Crocinitomix algicola TaxID=1740263 RepID=UPI001112D08E